jgi:hypothetical protein
MGEKKDIFEILAIAAGSKKVCKHLMFSVRNQLNDHAGGQTHPSSNRGSREKAEALGRMILSNLKGVKEKDKPPRAMIAWLQDYFEETDT